MRVEHMNSRSLKKAKSLDIIDNALTEKKQKYYYRAYTGKVNFGAEKVGVEKRLEVGEGKESVTIEANQIGMKAFMYSKIGNLDIKAKTISREAFKGCTLQSLVFREGVVLLGERSFLGVKGLEECDLVLPKSLETMKSRVFMQTGLRSITFQSPMIFSAYSLSGINARTVIFTGTDPVIVKKRAMETYDKVEEIIIDNPNLCLEEESMLINSPFAPKTRTIIIKRAKEVHPDFAVKFKGGHKIYEGIVIK